MSASARQPTEVVAILAPVTSSRLVPGLLGEVMFDNRRMPGRPSSALTPSYARSCSTAQTAMAYR